MELTREQKRAWLEQQIGHAHSCCDDWRWRLAIEATIDVAERAALQIARWEYQVAILHAELARVNGEPQ